MRHLVIGLLTAAVVAGAAATVATHAATESPGRPASAVGKCYTDPGEVRECDRPRSPSPSPTP